MPAARDGGRRLDRRPAHQCRPAGRAAQSLPALPRTTAAYLTLCNGRLTAQECLQQAIVNKVVPTRSADGDGGRLARAWSAQSSPLAVQAAGAAVSPDRRVPALARRYAKQLDQEIAETEDGAEGARAFTEKRKPVWKLR